MRKSIAICVTALLIGSVSVAQAQGVNDASGTAGTSMTGTSNGREGGPSQREVRRIDGIHRHHSVHMRSHQAKGNSSYQARGYRPESRHRREMFGN